jgi:hypothetical protein
MNIYTEKFRYTKMVFTGRSSGRPNLMDTTSFFIRDYDIERHFTILFEVVSSSNSVSSVSG